MYFQKKTEILKGRGVHDYRILRAWGGGVTHSKGKGGGQNMEAVRGWVWIISGLAHLINSQTRGCVDK